MKVVHDKPKLVYGLIRQMLSNEMRIVFLNNDVKPGEAKRGLFLKAGGCEGRVRAVDKAFRCFRRRFHSAASNSRPPVRWNKKRNLKSAGLGDRGAETTAVLRRGPERRYPHVSP